VIGTYFWCLSFFDFAFYPTVVVVTQNCTDELYDYPGIYLNQSQASELTKIYMQEEEASHKVITGTGGCRGFMSGYTFDLEEHYRDDLNTSYLLTQVRHVASVGESYTFGDEGAGSHYSNHFVCIQVAIPFIPKRFTTKPIVKSTKIIIIL
jgi:type VI secretion system secreted protein VgrG